MKVKSHSGLTLTEMIISLVLLGFISLSIMMFLLKYNQSHSSLEKTYLAAFEIHALVNDIQQDLHQGAYISSNSYQNRLEYTTYDGNGDAVKKIYKIDGDNYLWFSLDGGTTWISPYRISKYNQYRLAGTPQFLFADFYNNCTLFSDTNANLVWNSGTDATSSVSCDKNTNSAKLSDPSQASKVILKSFQFTGIGTPMTTRALMDEIFIDVAPGYVRSTSAVASPAAKDSPKVQSFDTATANSLYGTAFGVRGLNWDPYVGRLIIVGHHSATSGSKIFLADRNGVLMGNYMGLLTQDQSTQLDGVAIESDHTTVLALDGTANKLYRFNLNTDAVPPLNPVTTISLSGIINSPVSVAYNPQTDYAYIVGSDPGDSQLKVFECNKMNGTLTGAKWALPPAFDASHPPSALVIEPTSMDFLVVRNYVNGSAPNHTIDIYRINYGTGSYTSFSVNTDDLNNTTTGTAGYWGIAYDASLNRIFLSDNAMNKVYEIVPNLLITPRR